MVMVKWDPDTGRNRYWNYPAGQPYNGYWTDIPSTSSDAVSISGGSAGIVGTTVRNSDNSKKLGGTFYADKFSNSGSYVTISAGGGNDVIYNAGNYVSINGANDSDSISVSSSAYGVTIRGGKGDDTMAGSYSYGDTFQFGDDDGYDVITNYSANDTIHLTETYNASGVQTSVSGSDKVLKAGNSYVLLKGAANTSVKVKLASGGTTTISGSNSSSSSSSTSGTSASTSSTTTNTSAVPSGLTVSGKKVSVSTKYNGGVWLYGYDVFSDKSTYGNSSAVTLDASNDSTKGRILAGNGNSNVIKIGKKGSQAWGGLDGQDSLWGGTGCDTFWAGKNEDDTYIYDCGKYDLVKLWNVDFNDLQSVNASGKKINAKTKQGDLISVQAKSDATSTTFQLADNTKWQYTYSNKKWKTV